MIYALAGMSAVFFSAALIPLLMALVLWWGWVAEHTADSEKSGTG
jgi:hypothetical protein